MAQPHNLTHLITYARGGKVMKEDRANPRFDVVLDAQWQGSTTHCNVRIVDLSAAGCYVDTILEVIVGEAVRLKIFTSHDKWFEVKGIVAYHSPGLGFGLRFVDLEEGQLSHIRSLISQTDLR